MLEPVHISRLKLMGRSPMHYAAGFGGETAAMERGTALHSLVLEVGEVVEWNKVSDKGNQCPRRGKDFDAFEADHPGALILMPDEFAKAREQADAVLGCREAMRVLQGAREQPLSWRFGSREAAGTPDVLTDGFVTELKSTVSSDPNKFMWQSLRMAYHAQLAWYQDGAVLSGAGKPEAAFVVAVESTAPYPVTVMRLTDRALDQGRRLYRLWFERLLVCEAADEWPPYAQGVVPLDVPDDDRELDFGDETEAA